MNAQITDINTQTGEVTVRDLTEHEIKSQQDFNAEQIASKAVRAKAKADAEAKLAALGLTIDDLKALGLGGN